MSAFLPAVVAALALVALPARAMAQGQPTNLAPNPSFEQGAAAPTGWQLFSMVSGNWELHGKEGERCISVRGDGQDSGWWAAPSVKLEPRRLYRLSYWVRRGEGDAATVIAGLSTVNRDTSAEPQWSRREFFFRTPDTLGDAYLRLGQWHLNGTVHFDDITLEPAVVAHGRAGELELPLGHGERLIAGQYTALHILSGPGSTDFRCLEGFTASFNSNRWVFAGEGQVIYRYQLGRLRQADAEVEVAVNWHERGALVVEASRDGRQWVSLGSVDGLRRVAFPVPSGLLPAREVWVRLRTAAGASLQVDHYQYRCRVPEAGEAAIVGASQYLGVSLSSSNLRVAVEKASPEGIAELVLTNRGPRRSLEAMLAVERDGAPVAATTRALALAAGGVARVELACAPPGPGRYTLRLTCRELGAAAFLWEAKGDIMLSPLHDTGGELLTEDPALALWWCEPERKVSRTRPLPRARGDALRIAAAGNEWEPAQLVISPRVDLRACELAAGDLVSDSGARLPAAQIEIRQVEYVFVSEPTDEVGSPDWWPDPLPPLRGPMDLEAGRNHPFWITVHVPPGTPPGEYRGEITVRAAGVARRVPLRVRVWGFDLPRETHVRSGFGLSPGLIRRYHNLETEAEARQVLELYYQSFASHRIAPYSVGGDIQVTWEQLPSGAIEPRLDFSAFDAAAHHALDELGFNSFVLPVQGLGGGTFHSRYLGEIAGHRQGTPEHEAAFRKYLQAVQRHLEEKGWLSKAYLYWFDEPAEKDHEFVRQGMELIGRAAPGLTRMLTTHPQPSLYGAVDLWCLPTYTLDREVVRQRQREGEEIWWYLCTAPKTPHFTLFLDHHGTEIRVWLWQTWKYGLQGILVWQTNYWTSEAAYPPPQLQNPWQDPMSWVSGYDTPAGVRQSWGNGDGRFFYPPNRDPARDVATKYLEGPVPSVRWELLRDGIEDYEYFWLLREEVNRVRQEGADPSSYQEAEKLLEVPADVCVDPTRFATSPEPIHAHRARLAKAIERLRER